MSVKDNQEIQKRATAYIRKSRGRCQEYDLAKIELPDDDNKTLKNYLKHIINIETAIQTSAKQLALLNIFWEQNEIRRKKFEETKKNELKRKLLLLDDELLTIPNRISDYVQQTVDKRIADANLIKPNFNSVPVDIEIPTEPVLEKIVPPKQPQKPILQQEGLFNKKRIRAENDQKTQKYNEEYRAYVKAKEEYQTKKQSNESKTIEYQAACQKYAEKKKATYERAMKEYSEALERLRNTDDINTEELQKALMQKIQTKRENVQSIYDEAISNSNEEKRNILISSEIEFVKMQLDSLIDGLSRLYSYDILYEKYQNLIAVTSILEYIDSKRCLTLEGPDGAYNLFESELRTNNIVAQLSEISESLDAIKNNQYLLYRQLQELNENVKNVSLGIDKCFKELESIKCNISDLNGFLFTISQNTSQITANTDCIARNTEQIVTNTEAIARFSQISAHYSEVSAYYAKKNAELTNALGFVTALK